MDAAVLPGQHNKAAMDAVEVGLREGTPEHQFVNGRRRTRVRKGTEAEGRGRARPRHVHGFTMEQETEKQREKREREASSSFVRRRLITF